MKLTATTLAFFIGLSSAAPAITSNSAIGRKLLSQARRLNYSDDDVKNNNDDVKNNNDDAVEEEENQATDFSWVANYAIKFQGCQSTPQWNQNAGEHGIKLTNLNLVRFRLCPNETCSIDKAYGCTEGYGDYIISMDTYLQTYLYAVEQDQEYNCEYARNNECGCYNNDNDNSNGNDYYSFEKCEYDCFMNKGMEYCISNNPYAEASGNGDDAEEQWDLKSMVQCQQIEVDKSNQIPWYTGAYCSDDGGSILLGVFTDETCTNLYSSDKYATLTGKNLPYTKNTLIGTECVSCKESSINNSDNDAQDSDQVKEVCGSLYEKSGKCEQNMKDGGSNNNACQYMEGIKIVYKEGGLYSLSTKNSASGVFIGGFCGLFTLLSTYAWYLKGKLDRAKVQLSDD